MWKANRRKIILTSLVILLPIAAGLMLWNRLPDFLPTHFGLDNQPNGWSSKPFAVLGMPAILLALHLFCVGITSADPKGKNVSPLMWNIVLWICPVASVFTAALTYSIALGAALDVGMIVLLFVGILYLILGNYLPKCRPNYTVGIRTPWALNDPDNWHKTHRLAGWTMTLAGLVTMVLAFFHPLWWLTLSVLLLAALLPGVYSYLLYHRQKTAT